MEVVRHPTTLLISDESCTWSTDQAASRNQLVTRRPLTTAIAILFCLSLYFEFVAH